MRKWYSVTGDLAVVVAIGRPLTTTKQRNRYQGYPHSDLRRRSISTISASSIIRDIIFTLSIGYFPLAVSPLQACCSFVFLCPANSQGYLSISASAPSYTALVISEVCISGKSDQSKICAEQTSARVGLGLSIILSSIWTKQKSMPRDATNVS